MSGQPSDDMIVLAAVLGCGRTGVKDGWWWSEDIHSVLRRLGFDISSQKLVGILKRLIREDSPMVESRPTGWERLAYRVTCFGWCQLENHFPAIRVVRRAAEEDPCVCRRGGESREDCPWKCAASPLFPDRCEGKDAPVQTGSEAVAENAPT